jgi:TonB-dependent SusC/RagA subfamily outer membrane receptor
LPEFVKRIDNNVDWVEIWVKNREKETYDFKIPAQKAAFEKKYGNIVIPPLPPVSADAMIIEEVPNRPQTPSQSVDVVTIEEIPHTPPTPVKLPVSVQKINISNKKATVIMKNGQKENYDLNNAGEKENFEKKYGKMPDTPTPPSPAIKNEKLDSVVVDLKNNMDRVDASLEGRNSPDIIYNKAPVTLRVDSLNEPLFIINGVIENRKALQTLKPDFIEAMNVLKGKSAIALYGEKGKNGVIVITTKKAGSTTTDLIQ